MPVVRELLSREEVHVRELSPDMPAMVTGEITAELLSACCRLIDLLTSPRDIPFLSGLIQREIIYRLLCGPACQYALAPWKELTRFLEYPELELSTNLAENSMRPVALGRKNWIHIGSPQAGPKVAAILSVVESCRRLQVPVRDYFSTILPGLADLPIRCLPDLTPAVWVARHS